MRQIQLMMCAILLHQLTGSPLHASTCKQSNFKQGYTAGYTDCYKKIQKERQETQQLNQRKSEVQEKKAALVLLAALGSGALVNGAISSCTGNSVFADTCGFVAGSVVAATIITGCTIS